VYQFELCEVFDTIGPSGCVSLWPYLMHFYVINFLFVIHNFKLESYISQHLVWPSFFAQVPFCHSHEWMSDELPVKWKHFVCWTCFRSNIKICKFCPHIIPYNHSGLTKQKMCNLLLICWWSISQWEDLKNTNPFISYKRISKLTRF